MGAALALEVSHSSVSCSMVCFLELKFQSILQNRIWMPSIGIGSSRQ